MWILVVLMLVPSGEAVPPYLFQHPSEAACIAAMPRAREAVAVVHAEVPLASYAVACVKLGPPPARAS